LRNDENTQDLFFSQCYEIETKGRQLLLLFFWQYFLTINVFVIVSFKLSIAAVLFKIFLSFMLL